MREVFPNPTLTAAENARLIAIHTDPNWYTALPVDVQIQDGKPGSIAVVNGIEVALIPAMIVVPTAMLRFSTILDKNGQIPDPLDGRCSVLAARLLTPCRSLAREPMTITTADVGDVLDVLEPVKERP